MKAHKFNFLKNTFFCLVLLSFVIAQIHATAIANAISDENLLPGSPASQWDVIGAGDASIQGFATDISVNRGQNVSFKIDTTATSYRLDIYRLGYYGGNGARLVDTVPTSATIEQNQPNCLTDSATGLIDCGNWAVSASWTVPANATSGIYFAKAVSTTGSASHIFFIVRNDSSTSALLYKTSDTTWQAYNDYGGNSLYGGSTGSSDGRAYKVSYNRPFNTRDNQYSRAWFFGLEYPLVRWLEANGYDISYVAGADIERGVNPLGLISQHRVLISSGHDEYWSAGQRANVEAARNAGVNLAFFSGNEIFWKTRWENSIDGSSTTYRTLVSYKETKVSNDPLASINLDPTSFWTGTWRDPRSANIPTDGGRPENALSGTIFTVNCCQDGLGISVPEAYGKLRFWRNTSVATLTPGATATLPLGTLGYEWDEALDNGFMPAGLIRLSRTTVNLSGTYLLDYGNQYGPGTATHSLTLYRDKNSGAQVFSSGTNRWSWGLDNNHDADSTFPIANTITPDIRMRQATVNLLADMGAQPASLQFGLVAATQSIDTTPPVSIISSPTAGASVQSGALVTISGTATENIGGGVVGGVEVSTDGGSTWHQAAGQTNWSYSWIVPSTTGFVTLKARAIDDSGNQETVGSSVGVTVLPQVCPCNIWPSSATPAFASTSEALPVELGVKFSSDVNGSISGIRFYKGAGNTGEHVGHLWSSTGALLASATFSNESASGWQQVSFGSPVNITAGTTYIASYYAPNGGYAYSGNYFATQFNNGNLHALSSGASGGNGVFFYGAPVTNPNFPNQTFNSTNYWVDVVFNTTSVGGGDTQSPTAPTGLTATATSSSQINLTWTASTDNVGVTGYQVERCQGAGCTLFSQVGTSSTTSFNDSSLLAGTTYLYRVRATDAATNTSTYSTVVTQTTQAATTTGLTIWPSTAIPFGEDTEITPVELGVKFKSDVAGTITGIRFYKGINNTGPHVGHLWTSTGTLLATVNFGSETASGWQQANFSAPVAISADTVYVVSYYAPVGRPSYSSAYFATAGFDNAPLHALSNGTGGGNGVFFYGAPVTNPNFPNQTFNSTNYWVDVVFNTTSVGGGDTQSPTAPTGLTATATSSSQINLTWTASTDNVGVTGYQVERCQGAGCTLFSQVGTSSTTSFNDSSLLAGTTYLYRVRATDAATNTSTYSTVVTQTTQAATTTGLTIWPSTAIPFGEDTEITPVELGVKFKSDVAGTITGIRFYKGINNTGPHVGHLWTSTGTLLATVNFGSETASGWQQANFSAPVAISADTVYVVSYYAPVGRPSYSSAYFATAGFDNAPLHALSNGTGGGNGVFFYGAPVTNPNFPNQTFNSTNYWVDVVFNTGTSNVDIVNPTITMTAPLSAATVSGAAVTVSANASDNVGVTSVQFLLDGVALGSPDTAAPYSITWNSNSVTNGAHILSARAGDAAGNSATATGVSVTVSNSVISNTGLLSPTANAAVTISAGDNNGFQTTPTNAYGDGVGAAVDTNSGSNTGTTCTDTGKDKHMYSNYAINVPVGATIKGIEVRLDALVDANASILVPSSQMCVQLSWNGGTSWTAAKTTANLTTTETSYILGSATDIWGRTWALSDFSNTNFRVRIINKSSNTSRRFSLDWVAVRVTYQ